MKTADDGGYCDFREPKLDPPLLQKTPESVNNKHFVEVDVIL